MTPSDLATRFAGSRDLFQDDGRKPWHSVNSLVEHDGPCLRDLYSYNIDGRRAWERLKGWHQDNASADPGHPDDGDSALDALADVGLVRRLLDQAELVAVRTARRHGKSWAEIATRLGISTKTVEAHVSAVLRKLQLSNRHELSRWATTRRLVD